MGVLHHVRLSKLIEIDLTECKAVIVLELIVFGSTILFSGLLELLAISKGNLGLRAIGYSLNSNHASSLSQLADRGHLTGLKSHRTSEL